MAQCVYRLYRDRHVSPITEKRLLGMINYCLWASLDNSWRENFVEDTGFKTLLVINMFDNTCTHLNMTQRDCNELLFLCVLRLMVFSSV